MLHYHVWFNLKDGVEERVGLGVVREYLADLKGARETNGFLLLRNGGAAPRSKLPAYHALVEFSDAAALGAAMKNQTLRGIHTGGHGRVVDVVRDFHVEIFFTLDEGTNPSAGAV